MTTTDLKASAEQLHFAHAAESLNMTQPALSHQILAVDGGMIAG